MLLSEFVRTGVAGLGGLYPENEAKAIIVRLCGHFLGTKSYTHVTEPQFVIPESGLGLLTDSLDRLCAAEPLQYVLGYADFYGRRFNVSPSVLIPRPETESLCQNAIKLTGQMSCGDGVRVLDLCTGSGCIAWTMALELPGSKVVGVDISDGALAVAASQTFREGTDSGLTYYAPSFLKADVLDISEDGAMADVRNASGIGTFDIVLSNPPYIKDSEKSEMRSNVLEYEPGLALFVRDEDPLVFYRAIAQWSRCMLADGGFGIVEINETLGEETLAVFGKMFGHAELINDILDKNRFILYRK